MKIAIIGAGNMGGAIAHGLAQGALIATSDILVSDLNQSNLDDLKAYNNEIKTTTSNQEAADFADLIILAVKPWLVESVLKEVVLKRTTLVVSIAAGISFSQLVSMVGTNHTLFRVVPNTAISFLESMTFISSYQATAEQEKLLLDLFNEMGVALLIPETQISATTALASCGIAFALKYIHASMEAAIELGIYPKDAQQIVAQTVLGAATLLLKQHTHPALEIDKVTTPGGITIRGINELDHAGFHSAIIRAIKASC